MFIPNDWPLVKGSQIPVGSGRRQSRLDGHAWSAVKDSPYDVSPLDMSAAAQPLRTASVNVGGAHFTNIAWGYLRSRVFRLPIAGGMLGQR